MRKFLWNKEHFSKRIGFWKQIMMIVIGATISLVITILGGKLLENKQRAKDRRLSALMVMGNIEDFTQGISQIVSRQMRCDSLCTWLLSVPVEELELLPDTVLNSYVFDALSSSFVVFDKTAESIFSNNIETWKNMGNFQFINNVGDCFSRMHGIEEYWNGMVKENEEITDQIVQHSEQYTGTCTGAKLMRENSIRKIMWQKHNWICWLNYQIAFLQYVNKQNMSVIGISEQELQDFMKSYHQEIVIDEPLPDNNDFYTPQLLPEHLNTLDFLKNQLDSLKTISLPNP